MGHPVNGTQFIGHPVRTCVFEELGGLVWIRCGNPGSFLLPEQYNK